MQGTARCGADLNGCAPERRLFLCKNWNTAHGLESGCAACSPMATLLSAGCPYAYNGTQRTGWSRAAPLARLWSPALFQSFASPGTMRGYARGPLSEGMLKTTVMHNGIRSVPAHWLHLRPLPGRITASGCAPCSPMAPSQCLKASRRLARWGARARTPVRRNAKDDRLATPQWSGSATQDISKRDGWRKIADGRPLLLVVLDWRAWPQPLHALINGPS
jgi:hypothetical protein